MAGIGFELRRLARQETISGVIAAAGHAAVIAAGPWLFTILALAAISLLAEDVAGLEALAAFRVVIIYAFAVSLVVTAPIVMVAMRIVADALWLKKPQEVQATLFGALSLALAAVAAVQVVLVLSFELPWTLGLAFTAASLVVSQIWIALGFCGAVRDYAGVTVAFVVGLAIATLSSLAAAVLGLGAPGMILGFLLGLAITFFGMMMRVLATFPEPLLDPVRGIGVILRGLVTYWHLALGSLLGTTAVWIDKWIFWASPAHETVTGGLLHAPLYDSAMFIASLSIIPALSAFLVRLETDFFERYQDYYTTIKSHGTYRQIEAARRRLARNTLDNLTLITIVQVGIAAVLILTAPLIVDALRLQFRQIAILRFGALGTVFQFILMASSSIILFFDRRRIYLALQVFFLVTMAGFTEVSVLLGEETYGVGFFLSSLISSAVAYVMALRTFAILNYLTFLGNNPSIEPATYWRQRWWRRLGRRAHV